MEGRAVVNGFAMDMRSPAQERAAVNAIATVMRCSGGGPLVIDEHHGLFSGSPWNMAIDIGGRQETIQVFRDSDIDALA